MSLNNTYRARRLAVEGSLFYDNLLAKPDYVRTYFPPTANQPNYVNSPKIAIPFTSTYINRIVNLLHTDMQVEISNPTVEKVWLEVAKSMNWSEVTRDLFINTLVGGNTLAIVRPDFANESIRVETWNGEYVLDDGWAIGYSYLWNGEEMVPILGELKDLKKDQYTVTTLFDNYLMYNNQYDMPIEHQLGFNPAILFKSIDMDNDKIYGKPYFLRFRDMNIEYNHVFSQMSKAIKILQNVWLINADAPNTDLPIRFDPDTVNWVGKDGILQQVTRELNIDPEMSYLTKLQGLITNAAQVPDFFTGLGGVGLGNLPSGRALQIASGPLLELTSRIRDSFKGKFEELVTKSINSYYAFYTNSQAPMFDVNIKLNSNILPIDKQAEIETVVKLVESGIISPEEGKQLIAPLIGLLNPVSNL